MNDYRTKRRYRQQKLERSGFYYRRRQQSRARRRAATQASAGELPEFEQIFAAENLIRIYDNMQQKAGHAPGPDGITYDDLGPREVGQIMRQLSAEVINGSYEPSTAREVRIAKANGPGYRTLKLRSILYRVVAAALADALGPYFDRRFLPGSHGYRPKRSTHTMLLEMERIIMEQQRCVIAQDDIRNAFDHVDVDYVTTLLQEHITDNRLLIINNKILRGTASEQRTTGIDQGSPLSPLMLNVVLHHALDQPFSELAATPHWLRYADNLVYLCQTAHEGKAAVQAAQELLKPTGTTLKGENGIADLRKGQEAIILGLNIRWDKGKIKYDLPEESWNRLAATLSETRTGNSPRVAEEAIQGWVNAGAPAFEGKPETPFLDRLQEAAAQAGQREIARKRLQRFLQSARDRWKCLKQARTGSLGNQKTDNAAAPLTTDDSGHLVMPEAVSPQTRSAGDSALI